MSFPGWIPFSMSILLFMILVANIRNANEFVCKIIAFFISGIENLFSELRQSFPFEADVWIKFAPERINNEIYEQTDYEQTENP